MRNTIMTFAAGLALSLSTAALADDAQQPKAQPVSVTMADSGKLICHTFVHEGMLIRSNVCKTQKQWDEQRHQDQYEFSDFQNRTYSHPFGK